MKVAVLLSGQARYLELASYWWREKVFPKTFENIEVDYYCYFWDDGRKDLGKIIQDSFAPKKYAIGDYNLSFHAHRHAIRTANKELNDYNIVSPFVRHVICYEPEEFDNYAYNFPGMYIASAEVSRLAGVLDDYGYVIKTRSDCIIENVTEEKWLTLFRRMGYASNKLYCPWIQNRTGLAFLGDLAFMGKPDRMYNYLHNIDNQLISLATTDKRALSDDTLSNNMGVPYGHWLWAKFSLYSQTDWLSIPVFIRFSLLRDDDLDITKAHYIELEQKYIEEGRRRGHPMI
jgi:hypothetical protein